MAGAPKLALLAVVVLCLLPNSVQQSFPPERPSVPFQKIGGLVSFKIPPRITPKEVKIKLNKGKGSGTGKPKLRPFKLVVTKVIASTETNTVISPARPAAPPKPNFRLPSRFRPRIPIVRHLKTTTKPPIRTKLTTIQQDLPQSAQPVAENQVTSSIPIQVSPERTYSRPVYYPYWNQNNFIPFVPKVLQRFRPSVPPRKHTSRKNGLLDLLAWLPPRHAHLHKLVEDSNRFLDTNSDSHLANTIHAAAANVAAAGGGVVAAVDEAIIAQKIMIEDTLNITNTTKTDETPDRLPNVNNSIMGNVTDKVEPVDILPNIAENSTQAYSLPEQVQGVGSHVGGSGGSVVSAVDSALMLQKLLPKKTTNSSSRQTQQPTSDKTLDISPDGTKDSAHIPEVHGVGSHVGGSGGSVVSAVDSALILEKILQEETSNSKSTQNPTSDKALNISPDGTKDRAHIPEVDRVGSHVGGSAGSVVSAVDSALMLEKLLQEETTNSKQTQHSTNEKVMDKSPDSTKERIPEVDGVGSHVGGSAASVVGAVDSAMTLDKLLREQEVNSKKTEQQTGGKLNEQTGVSPDSPNENEMMSLPEQAHGVGRHVGGSAAGVVSAVDSVLAIKKMLNDKHDAATNQIGQNEQNSTTKPIQSRVPVENNKDDTLPVPEHVHGVGGHAGAGAAGVVSAVDSALTVDKVMNDKQEKDKNSTPTPRQGKPPSDSKNKDSFIPEHVQGVGGNAGGGAAGVVSAVDSARMVGKVLNNPANEEKQISHQNTTTKSSYVSDTKKKEDNVPVPEQVHKVGSHAGGGAAGVVSAVDTALTAGKVLSSANDKDTSHTQQPSAEKSNNDIPKIDNKENDLPVPEHAYAVGSHAGGSAAGVVSAVDTALSAGKVLSSANNKDASQTQQASAEKPNNDLPKINKENDLPVPEHAHGVGSHAGGSAAGVVSAVDSALAVGKVVDGKNGDTDKNNGK